MPFVPFPNTARVELRYTQDAQLCANIIHVEFSTPIDVGMLQSVGEAIVEWWGSHRTLVSSTVSLREIDLRDLTTASGIGIIYSTGLPLAGTEVSPQMPNSVTIAVKWGTGLTGRSFRGRIYHMGLCENQVTANALVPSLVAPLLASYNALITFISNVDGQMVVASRVSNGQPRVVGVTTAIINASYADTTIDGQRKRLPGRGR